MKDKQAQLEKVQVSNVALLQALQEQTKRVQDYQSAQQIEASAKIYALIELSEKYQQHLNNSKKDSELRDSKKRAVQRSANYSKG